MFSTKMLDNAHYTESFLLIFTLTKTYKWHNNNAYVAVNFLLHLIFFPLQASHQKRQKGTCKNI